MIAITSQNFCLSCIKAFFLLLRNALTFALVLIFGTVFIYIGIAAVGAGTGFASYFIIKYWGDMYDAVSNWIVPVVACGLVGIFVGALFMYIYDVATRAITLCFFTDNEIAERNQKAKKGESNKLGNYMKKK